MKKKYLIRLDENSINRIDTMANGLHLSRSEVVSLLLSAIVNIQGNFSIIPEKYYLISNIRNISLNIDDGIIDRFDKRGEVYTITRSRFIGVTISWFLDYYDIVLSFQTQQEEDKLMILPRERISQTAILQNQPTTPNTIEQLLQDPSFAGLVKETNTVMENPLSSADIASLAMLYNKCALPCEVILKLINYLASLGNVNMRLIERNGIRWSDAGIKTVDDADKEIERMTASYKAWEKVKSLFCIHNIHRPTKSQIENANRWINEWHFNDEMIKEAFEICVNMKGDYNLLYINAILKRWHEKGIKTLEDLGPNFNFHK